SRLHKLEEPRRFELTGAPPGEFVGADKLLERYGSMPEGQLGDESEGLLRSYLRNYDHQARKVPYVVGKFTVLDCFPLHPDKYFESGVAVLAQSVDIPNVFLEHIFPAGKEHLPAMERILATGLTIELRRSYDLSAIVHVSNLGGSRLLFTCMPLLYGPYGTTQNGSGFQLDPPKALNVKAGLPVVTPSQLVNGEARLAEYRRALGVKVASASLAEKAPKNLVGTQPGTVQAQASPAANPSVGPALVTVARALPVSTPGAGTPAKAAGHPSSPATPVQIAAVSPVPTPAAPKPVPASLAAATVPAPTTGGVSPGPAATLTTSPPPDTTGRVGAWQTYRPGQMPRGRLLDVEQTSDLADRGLGNEPMYLRGEFTVTAARENRAVLRSKQSLAERMLNRATARIIVEYPRGLSTPHEGETFQRGPERPFQVVDVRRGADGQMNVYVREVTTE
ncbi:MAG TPA: hypothetical protein VGD78_05660, partial [Chthoniobacterales bacterium]